MSRQLSSKDGPGRQVFDPWRLGSKFGTSLSSTKLIIGGWEKVRFSFRGSIHNTTTNAATGQTQDNFHVIAHIYVRGMGNGPTPFDYIKLKEKVLSRMAIDM